MDRCGGGYTNGATTFQSWTNGCWKQICVLACSSEPTHGVVYQPST